MRQIVKLYFRNKVQAQFKKVLVNDVIWKNVKLKITDCTMTREIDTICILVNFLNNRETLDCY